MSLYSAVRPRERCIKERKIKVLILSRRTDESIVIGDEVTITILSVKGKQVRIGITAPSDVSVHREEIYERIQSGGSEGTDNGESDGVED